MIGTTTIGDSSSIPRHVKFRSCWGRPIYLIDIGETTVPVMRATWREQRSGGLFHFDLGRVNIVVTRDKYFKFSVCANGELLATIQAFDPREGAPKKKLPRSVQIATITTAENCQWPLVCKVYCSHLSNSFRILDADACRLCYWKKDSGWGSGNARLLMSRRLRSDEIPIVLTMALLTLDDD